MSNRIAAETLVYLSPLATLMKKLASAMPAKNEHEPHQHVAITRQQRVIDQLLAEVRRSASESSVLSELSTATSNKAPP
jgi:hypothetical protein